MCVYDRERETDRQKEREGGREGGRERERESTGIGALGAAAPPLILVTLITTVVVRYKL